jgi:hypothetical protein
MQPAFPGADKRRCWQARFGSAWLPRSVAPAGSAQAAESEDYRSNMRGTAAPPARERGAGASGARVDARRRAAPGSPPSAHQVPGGAGRNGRCATLRACGARRSSGRWFDKDELHRVLSAKIATLLLGCRAPSAPGPVRAALARSRTPKQLATPSSILAASPPDPRTGRRLTQLAPRATRHRRRDLRFNCDLAVQSTACIPRRDRLARTSP